MPETAEKMAAGLGFSASDPRVGNLEQGGVWGLTPPGITLRKMEALFPRIEKEKADAAVIKKPKAEKNKDRNKDDGLLSFEQFQAVDLRVAEVVAAERIANSDKLLKLIVKVPDERTVVAGLAEFYSPEEMLGRRVLMVANLKPVKLMGVMSQGMLLAVRTEVDGRKSLLLPAVDGQVAAGSKVS